MDNPLDSPFPHPPNTNNKVLVQGVLLMLCWLLFFFNWGMFLLQQSQSPYFGGAALIITAILYFPLSLLFIYLFYKLCQLFLLGIEGFFWLFRLKTFQSWIQALRYWVSPLFFAFCVQLFLAFSSLTTLLTQSST